jgi:hypothetical protein
MLVEWWNRGNWHLLNSVCSDGTKYHICKIGKTVILLMYHHLTLHWDKNNNKLNHTRNSLRSCIDYWISKLN